jgi:hypothetical protein
LSQALAALHDFRGHTSGELAFSSPRDALRYLQDAYGADFLTKVLHMGVHAGLQLPPRRLPDVVFGDPILTRPGPHSTRRSFAWEVIVASAAATIADDVRFEEPDIVCSFQGRDFVIPVKTVNSEGQLGRRIKEGVKQAESRPHGGLVVVDVVALAPHDRLFELMTQTGFPSAADAAQFARQWSRYFYEQYPLGAWAEDIRRRTDKPIGVAFFTPLMLWVDGGPRSCWFFDVPLRSRHGPDYEFASGLLDCFNRVLCYGA